jgi:hypothetical protein
MSQPSATTSLDAIKAPLDLPEAPDKEARAEERHFGEAASIAKLTDHFYTAHKEHTDYLQKEHKRLQKENGRLQEELNSINPRYSALKQASKTNSFVDVVSLVAIAAGGGAISMASLGCLIPYTNFLFGGGAVSLFGGCGVMVFVKLMCWPKE